MSVPRVAAVAAATGFLGVALFQLSLALGAPLGHAAWGGAHAQLPAGLRLGSALSTGLLVIAAFIVMGAPDTGRPAFRSASSAGERGRSSQP